MRAFKVAWQAFVGFYNDLYLLIGLSVLWWVLGGIFVAAAVVLGWGLLGGGGPWWLAPIAAIPAGPALVGLAAVTQRCADGLAANRTHFFAGLRSHWRQALGLNAIGMIGLALGLLNLVFYLAQQNAILKAVGILWLYLIMLWLGGLSLAFPILVRMEKPAIFRALRVALLAVGAHPLFSLLLFLIAVALTLVSGVLPFLLIVAWPALLALLGQYALKLVLELAGVKGDGAA